MTIYLQMTSGRCPTVEVVFICLFVEQMFFQYRFTNPNNEVIDM